MRIQFLGFGKKSPGLWSVLLLFVTVLLLSCDQAPIFLMISREVLPRESRIKGVPTKMAIFEYEGDWGMYVASYSLHRYAKDGNETVGWDRGNLPTPPGRVFDLAATVNYLYALTDPDSPALYRLGNSATDWEQVTFLSGEGGRLQNIYSETNSDATPASNGYLYASISVGSSYSIFYTDGSNPTLTKLKDGTSLLTGAAQDSSGNHYFSTKDAGDTDGIYYAASGTNSFNQIAETGKNVMGLIRTPSLTLALCYNGDIFSMAGNGFTKLNSESTGYTFTGPAAVWRGTGDNVLLLVAIDARPTHGYREINISSGSPAISDGRIQVQEPGNGPPTTVDSSDRYKTTINPKPINAILQVPDLIDPDMTLFASIQGTGTTEKDTDGGLWSYRSRSEGWQWNGEE